MRKYHITIMIIAVFVILPLSYAFSGETTILSKKASQLKFGMSKQATIGLLGQPTWVIIPSDEGEFSLPNSRIRLELYWKNTPCAPVIVQFDGKYKTIGWDQGIAFCGKDVYLFEPPEEYLCTKADRAKFCE